MFHPLIINASAEKTNYTCKLEERKLMALYKNIGLLLSLRTARINNNETRAGNDKIIRVALRKIVPLESCH
jgi:hypothetical protein